jgi:hypothetical protein
LSRGSRPGVLDVLKTVGWFLLEYAGLLMVGIGGATVAILAFVGLHDKLNVLWTTTSGVWVSCLTLIVVAGYFIQVAQQKSRTGIMHELRTAKAKASELELRLRERHKAGAECFRDHLAAIGVECGFVSSERISVYSHLDNNSFRIVGRHSANGVFDSVRRQVHEPDQGIVAQAYQRSDIVSYDFAHDPNGDFNRYSAEQYERFSIPAAVVSGFKMKSRSYVAYPILNANKSRCIAVLVCESTILNRMTSLDARFKIKETIHGSRDSLRSFVEAADTKDDYVLQTQIANQ